MNYSTFHFCKIGGKHTFAAAVAMLCFAGYGAQAAVILEDNFNNGNVNNSDTAVGLWQINTSNGPGSANSLVESGGVISMSAGASGTGTTAYSGVSFRTLVQPAFNFFNEDITFEVRGINFTGSGTAASKQQFRLMLFSNDQSSYNADDAVVLRVRGDDQVRLGSKVDNPTSASDGNTQHYLTTGVSNVTGYDLTLGPGTGATDIDYSLTIFGDTTDATSGTFTFDEADWNGAGGDTGLGFWSQESNETGVNNSYTVEFDSLLVSGAEAQLLVIPEPSTATLLLLGLAAVWRGVRSRNRNSQ